MKKKVDNEPKHTSGAKIYYLNHVSSAFRPQVSSAVTNRIRGEFKPGVNSRHIAI
ncbi:MAG: hypothetical protein ACYC56_10200 [Candidatus Aquicultor sp.]